MIGTARGNCTSRPDSFIRVIPCGTIPFTSLRINFMDLLDGLNPQQARANKDDPVK